MLRAFMTRSLNQVHVYKFVNGAQRSQSTVHASICEPRVIFQSHNLSTCVPASHYTILTLLCFANGSQNRSNCSDSS